MHVHATYPLFGDTRCATCHALVSDNRRTRPATPAQRDLDLDLLASVAARAGYEFAEVTR